MDFMLLETATRDVDIQLRYSSRAKRVLLKILPQGVVEVVLPRGVDAAIVPDILQRRQAWISQKLTQLSVVNPLQADTHQLQPNRIELVAIDEEWNVTYSDKQKKKLQETAANDLILSRQWESALVTKQLRQWLQQKARQVFPDWLAQVSQETGLTYSSVGVRGQKTRWGSCSSKKHISLNRNLLFLPHETVRYLFIHELCHTVHMNHTKKYWAVVEKHMPDFRRHESVLRQAARTLPPWVYY